MAGTSATVGDDGGRLFHDRFPIWVGHIGDQHITFLYTVDIFNRDHPGLTLADAVADGPTLGQHLAVLLQMETFLHSDPGTNRLRAGL